MPKGIKGFQKGHTINNGKAVSEKTRNLISIANTKGENSCKEATHLWVAKWKGRPKICEMCGDSSRKFYDWANIDHCYKRILDDYLRMCRTCHRKYDIEFNEYGKKEK